MDDNQTDVVLIGGGIMSATLGVLLNHINPALRIVMIEQLPDVAMESTDAMNNAGTGHAGYCELNYTPESVNGDINIQRALTINAGFEVSLQLWSYLVGTGALPSAENFINKVPHLSLVKGDENINFLKRRYQLLKQHHLFKDMQFSDCFTQLKDWMPLIMANQKDQQSLAATYVAHGADVNFGALARYMVRHLKQQQNFTLLANTQVKQLKKIKLNGWQITLLNKKLKSSRQINADFVFIGAGGGTLPLLQQANVKASKGYGGFPVSGQWLVCNKAKLAKQHQAKVYGKAPIDAPPMSVPHLDTRIINGKPALLFGPFAGFTTKFLNTGSIFDLIKSIKPNNLKQMLSVGKNNLALTKYLIKEATQTHAQRMQTLREFLPQANSQDWLLTNAGKRVQTIKQGEKNWGRLEFGTEIVSVEDGSLAALLGASPGASISVQIMIEVLERCFKYHPKYTNNWQEKLKTFIPSYGESLIDNADLLYTIRKHNNETLKLHSQ